MRVLIMSVVRGVVLGVALAVVLLCIALWVVGTRGVNEELMDSGPRHGAPN